MTLQIIRASKFCIKCASYIIMDQLYINIKTGMDVFTLVQGKGGCHNSNTFCIVLNEWPLMKMLCSFWKFHSRL